MVRPQHEFLRGCRDCYPEAALRSRWRVYEAFPEDPDRRGARRPAAPITQRGVQGFADECLLRLRATAEGKPSVLKRRMFTREERVDTQDKPTRTRWPLSSHPCREQVPASNGREPRGLLTRAHVFEAAFCLRRRTPGQGSAVIAFAVAM
jgi:hypothetical protein